MLFKPDTNGYCAELKKHYSAIDASLSFDVIKSYILQAEIKYIRPILGDVTYNELVTSYQNNTLTTAQTKLLDEVQRCEVYYVFFDSLIFLEVFISDLGTQQPNTDKTTAVPQWKFNNLKQSLSDSADTFAENLLRFLEMNKADYPAWANSPAHTFATELLINSADDFNNYLPIQTSRRLFLKIRIFILASERNDIAPNISKEFLNEIKNQIKNNTMTPANAELLPYLFEAVCYFAFARALPSLSLISTSEGYFLTSNNDGNKQSLVIAQETKQELQAQYKRDAEACINQIKRILDKYVNDYPTYKNSEAYSIDIPKFYERTENEGRKTFSF